MNIKEIKEMINLMNENSLTELELERDGLKIRLRKHPSGRIETITEDLPRVGLSKERAARAEKKFTKSVEIKAPMVGTFYAQPEPGADPYVRVGDRISIGQTLCIIEAMKIMNTLDAEVTGVLKEVCVPDATPVEFGKVLFRVDPNG